MPILTYELGTRTTPNDRSTTGARDGYVAAIIKQDSDLRPAQVYSELAANRLAQFLGLPVAVGVAVQSRRTTDSLRFASLKAAESGLDYYDFTDHDASFDDDSDDGIVPGMHVESGHISALQRVCQRFPLETAQIAVFDLWIGNDDRPLIRREIQMMRLLTGRYSANLLPCHRIDHTDVGIQRVQNKQWRRL